MYAVVVAVLLSVLVALCQSLHHDQKVQRLLKLKSNFEPGSPLHDMLKVKLMEKKDRTALLEALQAYQNAFMAQADDPKLVQVSPDAHRNVSELIQARGFNVFEHSVTTTDGYVLSLQNIKGNGPVVYLQHGLLDCSRTWVNNLRDQSLAFMLADAGFDVWLGNVRGNVYSNRNIHFSRNQTEFWNFSYDEMILIDLPAMIDFITETTGKKKLVYIGHSQGTLMGFFGLQKGREIVEKVSLFIALAPVISAEHETNAFLRALANIRIDILLQWIGVKEFLPSSKFLDWLLPNICDKTPQPWCKNLLCILTGCDSKALDQSRMDVYVYQTPSGTSVKNMQHWIQNMRTKKHQMFDYGTVGNLAHYKDIHPPLYHPEDIGVPVVIISGGDDTLADPIDVKELVELLPADKLVYYEDIPSFGHLDFIWGTDKSTHDMYKKVVDYCRKYS